jgi:hypothetical protein
MLLELSLPVAPSCYGIFYPFSVIYLLLNILWGSLMDLLIFSGFTLGGSPDYDDKTTEVRKRGMPI